MSLWRQQLRDRLVRSRERALGFPRDTRAIAALRAFPGPFVPWTAMAMRPGAVLRIVNEASLNERRRIVELGAGVSTLYLARMLAARGGAGGLTTIEEDADWADVVRGQLVAEGNAELVDVIHAPLADGVADGTTDGVWYAPDRLQGIEEGVDLLVVDGPTSRDHPDRRYPALAFFRERLSARCAVILDDAWRPGEREVLRRWVRETPLDFTFIPDDGIAVAQRGRAFAI